MLRSLLWLVRLGLSVGLGIVLSLGLSLMLSLVLAACTPAPSIPSQALSPVSEVEPKAEVPTEPGAESNSRVSAEAISQSSNQTRQAQPALGAASRPGWTDQLNWSTVRSIEEFEGATLLDRVNAAQSAIVTAGGGVLFFPAGTYRFEDSLELKSGVILRGADPKGITHARDDQYMPPTRFEFPARGFKSINLGQAETASKIGVVNLTLNHARIALKAPRLSNCLVYGNRITHAVGQEKRVPQDWQKPEQRWTDRHSSAIEVSVCENVLVANNRLARATDNFVQRGYVLQERGGTPRVTTERDVVFDYDNRYGIRVNREATQAKPATPESDPHLFRKGVIVADNYVFVSGRVGIHVGGDGAQVLRNFIQGQRAERNTVTGMRLAKGHDTNEHRAIDIAGWNYRIEDNEFYDFRSKLEGGRYNLTDGEGILHQESSGTEARGGSIRRNRGNAYIGIYKTGVATDLRIEGNTLTDGADILLAADRNGSPGLARNNRITNNTVAGNITLSGSQPESKDNEISGNTRPNGTGKIRLIGQPVHSKDQRGTTALARNQGFRVVED
ncbi:right-handed parallel beta-helix repeat-containing protein [Leptolyngbya sp. FACHB-261]|uniref:right-handed parallel beta-helix repeat-containing protein n=1 Tax=Leptolyngbya sp. FACHB-261 TaxID=2692806 RepID=UPI001688CD4F|nr:right-handed parallel beta-helix repeat-containing protein [Leptolyngbya sp. FACHB-261]MBD2102025.1 right-handed parallel beta-helix repeat-containing protein [Leptolyngbya sp. FACHB-261]